MRAAARCTAAWTPLALFGDVAGATPALVIHDLAQDSRQVRPGALFLACSGSAGHGLDHADEALRRGAVAIAYEPDPRWPVGPLQELGRRAPLFPVAGLHARLGEIAARFFGYPSAAMTVVGVTGTNGKTSCSHFLAQALGAEGRCGVIGTLGAGVYPALVEHEHTTPDAVSVQRLLAQFRGAGARCVVMEVSSHALSQQRTRGVEFDVAVFTNLSRDHLDYHEDITAYWRAKETLFRQPGLRSIVVNADDSFGRLLLDNGPQAARTIAFGSSQVVHELGPRFVRALNIQVSPAGLIFDVVGSWGSGRVRSALLGEFNRHNLLAVTAVLLEMGMSFEDVLERIANVRAVPGRMERFGGGGSPLVVVDYAHTPDALEQALRAARVHCPGELWCLFGCGGERDRGKRPLMGAAAERWADRVVLADDNPRGEDGDEIIAGILAGMRAPGRARVRRDRRSAIAETLRAANEDDVVLVAGKGHEAYQSVGGRRLPLSDRHLVADVLATWPRRSGRA